MPAEVTCYDGLKVNMVEVLYIFLKRFTYPCRYVDLMPQLYMIANTTMGIIYYTWHYLFTTFEQPWLDRPQWEGFTEAIHQKGTALSNFRGFIDGIVRPMYNGHKKVHSIKFQSIIAPNGLIANLFGPMEGKQRDSAILAQSQNHSFHSSGNVLCIYGDPAHPTRQQIQGPF